MNKQLLEQAREIEKEFKETILLTKQRYKILKQKLKTIKAKQKDEEYDRTTRPIQDIVDALVKWEKYIKNKEKWKKDSLTQSEGGAEDGNQI